MASAAAAIDSDSAPAADSQEPINIDEMMMEGKTLADIVASPLQRLPWLSLRQTSWFTALLMIILSVPFWVVATNRINVKDQGTIPLFLTLCWYFIVSWTFGRAAAVIRLPPVSGYITSGFLLAYVQDSVWDATRGQVQLLMIMLVSIRVGLEVSPQDMTTTSIVLGTVPFFADALAVFGYSVSVLNYPVVPAGCFACIISVVGDGLILPALQAFKPLKLAAIPKVMYAAVPLETTIVFFVFGIFQGFAQPGKQTLGTLVGMGIFFKLFGTLLFALMVAFLFAQLAQNRTQLRWFALVCLLR
jgi:hypothetical protein